MPTLTAAPPAALLDVCCAPVTGAQLDQEASETLARIFRALGDPTRVRLLSLIATADGREACVCELTDPIGLSQPTVSPTPNNSSTPACSPANNAAMGPTTAREKP